MKISYTIIHACVKFRLIYVVIYICIYMHIFTHTYIYIICQELRMLCILTSNSKILINHIIHQNFMCICVYVYV